MTVSSVFIVFGKRKESCGGGHPEALDVIDEWSHEENPEWLESSVARHRANTEFENVQIVRLDYMTSAVRDILDPSRKAVGSTVNQVTGSQ